MDRIFHERQEGSLCAQHCLNALLQSDYYSADVLSDLAKELDHSERMLDPTQDKPSNCDDSGFFSIQVLQQALTVWNLELLPITSTAVVCKTAREDPRTQKGFICNFREHWFTIRLIGNQWFNLNSLLSGPELLSDTYLSLFLKQLQQEGYSIFVVIGELPVCEADMLLKLQPAVQHEKPRLLEEFASSSSDRTAARQEENWDESEDDVHLRQALEESRRLHDDDDVSLNRALQLSMSEIYTTSSHSENIPALNAEELRLRRLAHFDSSSAPEPHSTANSSSQPSSTAQGPRAIDELSEEQQLEEAIKLSMGNST